MKRLRTLVPFSVSLIAVSLIGFNEAKSCGWWGDSIDDDDIIVIEVDADGNADPDNQSTAMTSKTLTEIGNQFRIDKDYAASFLWYSKAADNDYAEAQNNLAGLYEFGLGVPQDIKLAAQWYQRAAQSGEAHAQHSMGILHTEGRGVVRDLEAAHMWLTKSTTQKHQKAFADMAKIQNENSEKLTWLLLAVHHGDDDATPVLATAKAASSNDDINKAEHLFKQWLSENQ